MVMKRNIMQVMPLLMAVAFTACTNESEEPTVQNKTIVLTAGISSDAGSRTLLGDDSGTQTEIYWSDDTSDKFCFNINAYDYVFTKAENTTNSISAEFVCNIGNKPVPTFTVGTTYTAKYPSKTIPSYASQAGTKEALKDYHYMEASFTATEGMTWENVPALSFDTKAAIVKLTLKHDDFKGKSVTSVSLKTRTIPVVMATNTFTGDETDGSIVAYFAVPSDDFVMSGITIHAACQGVEYSASLGDKTLAAGKLYRVNKTMSKATSMERTAEEAVKGDFAMADGTFISQYATLTDEQKDNVKGIVFWTTHESDPDNANSAKLSDDKIMSAENPDCTHGLIVSLQDIATNAVWQGRSQELTDLLYGYYDMECVYKNFQNTNLFSPENKSDYADVNWDLGDEKYKNMILGYNNTKVYEAYNAYCTEKDKSAYMVKLIDVLNTWKNSNPKIEGTTGWYLPSIKELYILCNEDYLGAVPASTKTKTVVNASLVAAGGSKFYESNSSSDYPYWSSTETSATTTTQVGYSALKLSFYKGNSFRANKSGSGRVRAVCAF